MLNNDIVKKCYFKIDIYCYQCYTGLVNLLSSSKRESSSWNCPLLQSPNWKKFQRLIGNLYGRRGVRTRRLNYRINSFQKGLETILLGIRIRFSGSVPLTSVAEPDPNPDPRVSGHPGSGSIS